MTNSSYTKKTTNLVYSITLMKEKELYLYKSKLLQLEKLIDKNPSNALHKYRYNLTKVRYEQLEKTTFNLRLLEFQLKISY